MAGTEERAARAKALRRLAHARGGAQRSVEVSVTGVQPASWGQVGLVVELFLSAFVAALVAMTLVAASGSGLAVQDIPAQERRITLVPQLRPEGSEDLDPRDPLVLCTVFGTYTRCVPEET
jgi:hypothetical protein